MALSDEQKRVLDDGDPWFCKRLNLVSHSEIENALADALEALVGGSYKIHITHWSESKLSCSIGESIEMSAIITNEKRDDPFATGQPAEKGSVSSA